MSIAEIAVPALRYHPIDTDATLPTVLIVEDERKLLWSLIEQFRALHIAPFTASRGYEALRIASESRPDLILLDGLLPEMHGFEIARFIRHIDADYHPHIAIMTAIYKGTRYQNEAKLQYGIDDYLIKPLLPHSIAGLVRRAMQRAHEIGRGDAARRAGTHLDHAASRSVLELQRCPHTPS